MSEQRIGTGKAGPGRPKGSQNKFNVKAKEAFQLAYEGVGGLKAFKKWAKANPTEFYKLFSRLIPTETHVSGADGAPLGVVILPRKEIDGYVAPDAQTG